MKEEANLQNEPYSMKNETARLRRIITDCLICRISKILLQAYRQKSKAHFSQDGIVNLHFIIFLLPELSKKKKSHICPKEEHQDLLGPEMKSDHIAVRGD